MNLNRSGRVRPTAHAAPPGYREYPSGLVLKPEQDTWAGDMSGDPCFVSDQRLRGFQNTNAGVAGSISAIVWIWIPAWQPSFSVSHVASLNESLTVWDGLFALNMFNGDTQGGVEQTSKGSAANNRVTAVATGAAEEKWIMLGAATRGSGSTNARGYYRGIFNEGETFRNPGWQSGPRLMVWCSPGEPGRVWSGACWGITYWSAYFNEADFEKLAVGRIHPLNYRSNQIVAHVDMSYDPPREIIQGVHLRRRADSFDNGIVMGWHPRPGVEAYWRPGKTYFVPAAPAGGIEVLRRRLSGAA